MARLILVDIFDIDSIRRAAREIEDTAKWIEKKSDELARRLAELGKDVALTAYADAGAEMNDDVDVEVVKEGKQYILRAFGSQVYFVEFGAGTAAGENYDTSVIEPPVPITPGSWSKSHGTHEFERWGTWHYKGVKYDKVVPRKGMYLAVKEIENNIKTIAEEVFLND